LLLTYGNGKKETVILREVFVKLNILIVAKLLMKSKILEEILQLHLLVIRKEKVEKDDERTKRIEKIRGRSPSAGGRRAGKGRRIRIRIADDQQVHRTVVIRQGADTDNKVNLYRVGKVSFK